ncbi:MAG: hypothetical protein IBJ10_01145 [Phycisphaerales bacterium]|nr:hypothetical protein [Phycisphaerales bacterium]
MIHIGQRSERLTVAQYRDEYFIPPHRPRSREYVSALAASINDYGWTGRPLLAIDTGRSLRPQLLTGSHRHAALVGFVREDIDLEIPVHFVTVNLCPGTDWSDDLANAVKGLLTKDADNDDTLARLIALERLSGTRLTRAIALMRRENREGR